MNYKVYLERYLGGSKYELVKVYVETNDYEEAYQIFKGLEEKDEIYNNETLIFKAPSFSHEIPGAKGAPLDEWEVKRVEKLKNSTELLRYCCGDVDLLRRGLIKKVIENGKEHSVLISKMKI